LEVIEHILRRIERGEISALEAIDTDLAPLNRTRSSVCHAAAFTSISAWACAGVR
jgi:hypothetical protein